MITECFDSLFLISNSKDVESSSILLTDRLRQLSVEEFEYIYSINDDCAPWKQNPNYYVSFGTDETCGLLDWVRSSSRRYRFNVYCEGSFLCGSNCILEFKNILSERCKTNDRRKRLCAFINLSRNLESSAALICFSLEDEECANRVNWILTLVLTFDSFLKTTPLPGMRELLTLRQREVLHWTSLGKTADEVATILSIQKSTVEKHLMIAKIVLRASNAAHAIRNGLLRKVF